MMLKRFKGDLINPAGCMCVTAVVYLVYILIYLSLNQYSPSAFVWFGDEFIQNNNAFSGDLIEKASRRGYDGQFFYRLALNPFTDEKTDFGITIDNPPYRQQRILYPLLVWLLAMGNPATTIFFMVLLNYLSICGIALFSAKLIKSFNGDIRWAVVASLYPGLVISLSRSLCEPLAIFFVILGLYYFFQKKYPLFSIFMTLAVLTRETTLLITICACFLWFSNAFINKERTQFPTPFFFSLLLPILAYISWQFYLFQIWGILPVMATSGNNIGPPLIGLLASLVSFFPFKDVSQFVYVIELLWIAFFAGYCLRATAHAPKFFSIIWVAYGLLALFFTPAIWNNHPGFYRALAEFHVVGIFMIALSKLRLRYYVLSIWLLFFIISACCEIYIQRNIPFVVS